MRPPFQMRAISISLVSATTRPRIHGDTQPTVFPEGSVWSARRLGRGSIETFHQFLIWQRRNWSARRLGRGSIETPPVVGVRTMVIGQRDDSAEDPLRLLRHQLDRKREQGQRDDSAEDPLRLHILAILHSLMKGQRDDSAEDPLRQARRVPRFGIRRQRDDSAEDPLRRGNRSGSVRHGHGSARRLGRGSIETSDPVRFRRSFAVSATTRPRIH